MSKNSNKHLTQTLNPNLNIRRPFLELTLRVNGIKIGIALGVNGLLVAVKHCDWHWLIAIGRWGTRR